MVKAIVEWAGRGIEPYLRYWLHERRNSVQADTRTIEPEYDPATEGLVDTKAPDAPKEAVELTDDIYDTYRATHAMPGSLPHPAVLSESAAMGDVEPFKTDYKPNLPKEVVTSGAISDAQSEAIVLAGAAHGRVLPDKDGVAYRQGFLIGDGTGLGKSRELLGIILDNMRRGRQKALFVSKNQGLINDLRGDWKELGQDPSTIVALADTTTGPVGADKGILFTTYSTLGRSRAEAEKAGSTEYVAGRKVRHIETGRTGVVQRTSFKGNVSIKWDGTNKTESIGRPALETIGEKPKVGNVRQQQIVDWLGKDFDGVLIFDEAHLMANGIAIEGFRGGVNASEQALAGIELATGLPKARVVYASATAAQEVRNLSYMDRLGLWGQGTPFADKLSFIGQIEGGGVAAMELVAKDMKALGVYLARQISYKGLSRETITHTLTQEQREIYNELARAWGVVLNNINTYLEATNADKNPRAKARIKSLIWSFQQRFFNQIITTMKMPSVIEDAKKRLEDGDSVVFQLVSTGDAATNRAIERIEAAGKDMDDLDVSSKDDLIDMIRKTFPTQKYYETQDENGNTQWVAAIDSEGKPIEDPAAVEARDALIQNLNDIRIPEWPLDILINSFGTRNIAEVTGRSRRVVMDTRTGEREIESTPNTEAEIEAFQSGSKRALVFSDAGGTGKSYHADLRVKNQQRRVHYVIQGGWSATRAVQGFGRTHRSNQKQPPHLVLTSTDIQAEKRFTSSIARRLDQLGALTRGQRKTGGQGMFSAEDNLENEYAVSALHDFIRDIVNGEVEGMTTEDLARELGLDNVADEANKVNESKLPEVKTFLNRLLSVPLERMDQYFNGFFSRLEASIEAAKASGDYDAGVENLIAEKVTIAHRETVFTDKRSGAETEYVEFELTDPVEYRPIEAIAEMAEAGRQFLYFAKNKRSEKVYAFFKAPNLTKAGGNVVPRVRRVGISTNMVEDASEARVEGWNQNYDKLTAEEARDLWQKEIAAAPSHRTWHEHMIVGAVLPVWDRILGKTRIFRTVADGKRFIGRVIPQIDLKQTLKNLGAGGKAIDKSPKTIIARVKEGYVYTLSNGWRLTSRKVGGETRVRVQGPTFGESDRKAVSFGHIKEIIEHTSMYFATELSLKRMLDSNVDIVDEVPPAGKEESFELGGDLRLTDDAREKYDAVMGSLKQRLERVGISDRVSLVLRKAIRDSAGNVVPNARGRYAARVIEIATGNRQKMRTLNHEIIHALKDLGVIRDHEWKVLSRKAMADAPLMTMIREKYKGRRLTEEKIVEEAIAEMHANWNSGQFKAVGFVKKALERIRNFFEAVGNAFRDNGFQTADQIFQRIGRGEMGARPSYQRGGIKGQVQFAVGDKDVRSQFSPDDDAMGSVPDNRNVDYLGFSVNIPAWQFLDLAAAIGEPNKSSLAAINKRLDEGGKLGIPFLEARWMEDEKRWQVTGHEGRHRVKAIVDRYGRYAIIPVHIFPKQGLRARHITPEMRRAPFVEERGSKATFPEVRKLLHDQKLLERETESFAIDQKQTDTAAFKRWFGDSKVVDENGEPLVVYHGTKASFVRFATRRQRRGFSLMFAGLQGHDDVGSWFASEPAAADQFTRADDGSVGLFMDPEKRAAAPFATGAQTMPVYLSLQNPKVYETYTEFAEASDRYKSGKGMRNALERQGYDGIIIRESNTDGGGERTDYVAFEPTQIKSAIGNRGTFDPSNPDISFELGKRPTFNPKAAAKAARGEKVTFSNSESERRWQEARKGVGSQETWLDSMKARLAHVAHGFSRHYIDLPNEARFSKAREQLRKLEAAPQASKEEVIRTLREITEGMSAADLDLFTRKVVLDDLTFEVENEHQLSFGFTPEDVETELAKVDQAMAGRPELAEKVELRRDLSKRIANDLVRWGVLHREQIKNPGYYRHQVLDYARAQVAYAKGAGNKLKTPHWARRMGSRLDINANLLEAEFEWMHKALTGISAARTIDWFKKSDYNVRDDVIANAKAHNDRLVQKLLEKDLRDRPYMRPNGKESSPLNDEWNGFKQRIAYAFSILRRALDTGELTDIPQEFQGAAESLSGESGGEGNIFPFLAWILDNNKPGSMGAAMAFKAINQRKAWVRAKLGEKYADPLDLDGLVKRGFAPEGHVTWQPDEGKLLFVAKTIPEHVVDRLLEKVAEDGAGPISADELRGALQSVRSLLAVGGPKYQMVLPEEVAKSLNSIRDEQAGGLFDALLEPPLRLWKRWVLINPRRVLKYNLNNLSGDLDAVLAGNPHSLTKLPQAIRELKEVMLKGKTPSDRYREAVERGVFDSGLTVQEIPDINYLNEFERLLGPPTVGKVITAPFAKFWGASQKYTQFRENWMRYAAYLDYVERLEAGESMRSIGYGGAHREMVDAIDDHKDRAALLARELVGDYGAISAFGRDIRRKVIPFYSWMEINTKRYWRLSANAWQQGIGQGFRSAGVLGAALGIRTTAWLTLRMALLYGLVQLWNNLVMGDEEDDLGADERARLHLILGRDANGEVVTVRFQGALSDFLGWFGFSDAVGMASEIERGRADIGDLLTAMAKAPVNKVVSGITPVISAPVEIMTGRDYWPDVFQPRTIRDKWRHIAQLFSMEHEYDVVFDRPSRGYVRSLTETAVYRRDPRESAYNRIKGMTYDWLRTEKGEGGSGGYITPRSQALYDWRQALKFGDTNAEYQAMARMRELGIDDDAIASSIRNAHPLGSLSLADRAAFLRTLSSRERQSLQEAIDWYEDVFVD